MKESTNQIMEHTEVTKIRNYEIFKANEIIESNIQKQETRKCEEKGKTIKRNSNRRKLQIGNT